MSIYRSTFWRVLLLMVILSLACSPGNVIREIRGGQSSPGPEVGLEHAKQATIRIVSTGSFKLPKEDGSSAYIPNLPGQSSGFIIDSTGIAITNNHGVSGASYFDVWVGDETKSRGARLLGVSECSDLAVIDIDGDGFPYLEWYDGPIETGLDVIALGFPTFGNTEITVNKGAVSKAQAEGRSTTSSVSNVIEHDATINRGNSGGPLIVEADGRVVGINYAGNEINQYFAITRDEATPVIKELREGRDVDSLGINGEAFIKKIDDDTTLEGIWVAAVDTDSPAGNVGLQPGDFILKLKGLFLINDETSTTMDKYCKILRSRANPDDKLKIELYRADTDECIRGEINGGELKPVDCRELFGLAPATPEATSVADTNEEVPPEITATFVLTTKPEAELTPTAFAGVATANANVRSGPSTDYQVIDSLTAGDEVTIFERTVAADWLSIRTPAPKNGWVASEFVKFAGGTIKDVPVAAALPPKPAGPSSCSLTLGVSSAGGSIPANGNSWCIFSSGSNNTAQLVAFLRNADKVQLYVYRQSQEVISDGRIPADPDQSLKDKHVALIEDQGTNRDQDPNTKELIWQGPVEPNTKYYVRLANRGGKSVQFCLAPRDAYSCP